MQLTIRESASNEKLKVDTEKGIIFDVKVLNESSRNGFYYPRETRLKAHRLIENLKVNIDHLMKKNASEDVPLEARFGKLQNVREVATGTIADLKYNVKHRLAESIVYAALELPDTFGLSINGAGRGTRKTADGKKIVDEIIRLKSCDLVSDPGSTHSLFESDQNMEPELNPEMEAAKAHVNTVMNNAKTVEELKAALAEFVKGEEEEEEVEESDKTRLKLEKDCMVLCESMKYPVTLDTIELLADLPDEAKRKAMITKLKAGQKPSPRSAALPIRESEAAPADPEAKKKHLLKILRS